MPVLCRLIILEKMHIRIGNCIVNLLQTRAKPLPPVHSEKRGVKKKRREVWPLITMTVGLGQLVIAAAITFIKQKLRRDGG